MKRSTFSAIAHSIPEGSPISTSLGPTSQRIPPRPANAVVANSFIALWSRRVGTHDLPVRFELTSGFGEKTVWNHRLVLASPTRLDRLYFEGPLAA